jgi:mono/diheme cytochrome c family protein
MLQRILAALLGLGISGLLRAQIGDRPEEGPQVALPAVRKMTPEPALTPQEELRTFQLPPGFRIELVAAEPLVHDPVAAAYDLKGDLWVVEMNNYNTDMIKDLPALADGAQASEVSACKIIKLESSRGDGHFDRRIVWLDGLARARGIAIVHDGVLIADSPNLWLARDTHGTGKCDEKILVVPNYEGWTDPEESGSLLWGRDNIIHDIDYTYDYRYRSGKVQAIAVPVRGQFGISQDDYGRLFFNRNSDQLRCDLYAPTYGVRSPHVTEIPWANVRIAENQEVWPSHQTPAINRAYRKGVLGQQTGGLRDNGTLLEFTAACSPLIYRGANYPASFYGNAFVPEPCANLIKRNILLEAQGQITAVNAYEGREFLTSTDTRFRPVALVNAPDGSMLVVDMYRGVLQEYHFITTYLRDQSLGRKLQTPLFGKGRLFKITHEAGPIESKRPNLAAQSAIELAALLAHPNGWWRDTAQQELVERADRGAVAVLQDLAVRAPAEVTRIHALWTLEGLEAIEPKLLRAALGDASAKVRAAAVRLHEPLLAGKESDAGVAQLLTVLRDPQPEVIVQLALSLGEAKTTAGLDALYRVLLAAGEHPFVPKAIATGLSGREFAFFQRLASEAATLGPRPEIGAMLKVLASAIVHQGDRAQIQELVARATQTNGSTPTWARIAIVDGFEPLTRAAYRRSMGLTRVVPSADLVPLAESSDAEVQSRGAKLVAALVREEEAARQRAASARPLTAEEQKRYEQGREIFQVCMACHQPTGTGLPSVAPSLVDSHWVTGYPEVLARIVLNGKEGTPGFPGAMPPIGGTFGDEQVAAVLTYIRNSWGLQAGAVSPATVAAVRAVNGSRQAAWTDAELRRMESETGRQYGKRKSSPPAPSRP